MKALLILPKGYSGFSKTTSDTLKYLGYETHIVYPGDYVKGWHKKVSSQMFRFPFKYRTKWEKFYLDKINRNYEVAYDAIQPDLVFVYNNGYLRPETLSRFKKKSKIAFFLGDCPYYTATNRHFLPLLFYADGIFTTDSFWIEALHKLGLKNLEFMYPSLPPQHFKKPLDADLYNKYKSEVLYIGMCYKTSWGFKKASFLNSFTDFDLHLHGDDSWKRWFDYFPKLEDHYRERTEYFSVEKINDMYNATKIAPVDANPGLLHAIHWRFIEALASGALPVLEWQQGVDEIFGNENVPAVKCFDESKEVVQYYLNHENERLEKVAWLTKVMEERFSIENNADLLANTLNLKVKPTALAY